MRSIFEVKEIINIDRLSNPAKVKAFELAEELKNQKPLFDEHMDDIVTGRPKTMMEGGLTMIRTY